mmetsp:Transcript_12646/g.27281  ORF Transcript_12646/g.27281 Transcript_12646/m.27281 type:complete len:205 (-) Transcript_12646:735-1349(-)
MFILFHKLKKLFVSLIPLGLTPILPIVIPNESDPIQRRDPLFGHVLDVEPLVDNPYPKFRILDGRRTVGVSLLVFHKLAKAHVPHGRLEVKSKVGEALEAGRFEPCVGRSDGLLLRLLAFFRLLRLRIQLSLLLDPASQQRISDWHVAISIFLLVLLQHREVLFPQLVGLVLNAIGNEGIDDLVEGGMGVGDGNISMFVLVGFE